MNIVLLSKKLKPSSLRADPEFWKTLSLSTIDLGGNLIAIGGENRAAQCHHLDQMHSRVRATCVVQQARLW